MVKFKVKLAGLLVCYNGKPLSANFTTNFPVQWLCMGIHTAINLALNSHMREMGTHLYNCEVIVW